MNRNILITAISAIALLAAIAGLVAGWKLAAAALIGGFAGIALYHASFGFTGAWRRFVREKRGAGLRAQLLLIGLACLFTYPLMQWGAEIGLPARGYILPMGLASAIGAAIFGVGMQLGGGCASGTLFTAGGGSTRMVVVLIFFIAGSVWATAHWDFWASLPMLNERRGVSLPRELGTFGAMAAMCASLAAIWWLTTRTEAKAHGALEPRRETASLLTGPWSLALGAVALAVVSILTMLVLGRPWGVTAGFALWGAKIVDAFGADVTSWTYWSGWRKNQLEASLFANRTSVMNFGILFGAMAAAALAGKFAPVWRLSPRDVATAVIGGLLMGYGARLAYGCNIGAFLGGMVSGSLHGWWWLIWGFIGSLAGVRLREIIGMDPPRAPRPAV